MSVIDTLITDRTQADVDELRALLAAGDDPPADHKGAYNASDLNRVGAAVSYLQGRLSLIGITTPGGLRTDWTAADIPTAGEMDRYLASVAAIQAKLRDYRPDEDLPGAMRQLDFNGANRIESLLSAAEEVVRNVQLSYRGYSGRLRAGVNCLP